MADTPIAKIEDVEDRLGYTIEGEDKRVRMNALLVDASAAVRAYCGRPFASGPVTLRVRVKGGIVRLGAAVSITSVTSPTTVPPGAAVPFQFDGLDRVYLWPSVYLQAFDWEFRGMPSVVDIAFVAEDDTPDAVLAVCCQMAMRAYGVRPEDSGKQQESIAGYSYSTGTSAASGGVGMLPDERAVLDQFRNVGATAWLGISA
jgi:hypothetical protein